MKTSQAHAWEAHIMRVSGLLWAVKIVRRDLVAVDMINVVKIRRTFRLTKTGARLAAQRLIERRNRDCGTHEPITRVVNVQ